MSPQQLAVGVPYACAAVVEPAARLVLTAGACPLDAGGATVGVGADRYAASGVVHRHLGDHEPPGTLLGVTALGHPDQLVEVEAVAALA